MRLVKQIGARYRCVREGVRDAMMKRPPRPIRIPVPGMRQTVGLGQAIKRVTTSLGVRPCGGCQKRARTLDRFVSLVPPRSGK